LILFIKNVWGLHRYQCVFAHAQCPEDIRTNFQTQERVELPDQSLPRRHGRYLHQLEYKSARGCLTRRVKRNFAPLLRFQGKPLTITKGRSDPLFQGLGVQTRLKIKIKIIDQ
jgi:hypothetical protein